MSATWNGVNLELETRAKGMMSDAGGWLSLSEGFRTYAEQKAFYDAYLRGGTLAARPGTSNHEKGLAVDLACPPARTLDRAALGRKWGLYTPVPGEPWHFELDPLRKPLQPTVVPDKVKPMFNPPYVLRPIVASMAYQHGGVLLLGDDGSVYAFEGAPYKGGPNGKDYFKGRKPARIETPNQQELLAGKVYTVIATSGERYAYPE